MRAVLLFSLFLFSCGNSHEFKESPSPLNFNDGSNLEAVTFEQVRSEVFEKSCTQCHSLYNQFDSIKSELTSITASIQSLRMPKNNSLSSSQRNTFELWIAAGAPGPDVVTEPPELEATYASVNQFIFAKKCTACHSPLGQVPFLDLSTRFAIFKQRELLFDFEKPDRSYILEVIQDPIEPMPPKDSRFGSLTDKEIKILQKWIGLGLP